MPKETINIVELVDRLKWHMERMDCANLVEFVNKEFDLEVTYLGDGLFEMPDGDDSDSTRVSRTTSNNGTIEFDREDGTIRYYDVDGNTEGIWEWGDDEYARYKEDWFPDEIVPIDNILEQEEW